MGKTALVRALLASGLDRSLNRALIYSPHSTGVRSIVEAAGSLAGPSGGTEVGQEDPTFQARPTPGRPTGGVRARRSLLFHQVQQGRWLLVLDQLSSRDPGIRHLLEGLFDYDVLALAATRSAQVHDLGNVAKTLWRWSRVDVPPLGPSACQQLVEQRTGTWPLDAARLQDFRHRLLRLAEGNPGVIVEICRRAEARLGETGGRVDPQQIRWDWLGERCH